MRLATFIVLLCTGAAASSQDTLSEETEQILLKRMNEHAFTIIAEEGVAHEGCLLFANDSVLGMWVDNNSVIDFERLNDQTVFIIYYDRIKSVNEGTSYKSKIFAFKADIFGDYDNYTEVLDKLKKKSLYRWFIPEPLIDYAEETMY